MSENLKPSIFEQEDPLEALHVFFDSATLPMSVKSSIRMIVALVDQATLVPMIRVNFNGADTADEKAIAFDASKIYISSAVSVAGVAQVEEDNIPYREDLGDLMAAYVILSWLAEQEAESDSV